VGAAIPNPTVAQAGYPGAVVLGFYRSFGLSIKNNGQWRRADQTWVKVNGQWREIYNGWVKVDGQWRELT
jgi:hypothetical protein